MFLQNGLIRLSEDKKDNILQKGTKYYQVDFLKGDGRYVQGGNGIVFALLDEQENLEYVVKFLKFPEQARIDKKIEKRARRFEREIEALWVARTNELPNVVRIEFDGVCKLGALDFQYYVMEKCERTLNHYLNENANDLDVYQRTLLCQKILYGIKALNAYKIYHRDIKHDNIFFIGNEPLIGDLGLVDFRGSDILINEKGDLIGPTGWFSPEAINKHLCERTLNPHKHDCSIDDKSEVFQLGKLFWFIYQGNLPIGQIIPDDFVSHNQDLYKIVFEMLSYSKSRRIDSTQVESAISGFLSRN